MNKEEIKELLQEFGLPEGAAEYYAEKELEDERFAWLSAFRFVRPMNNSIEWYKNEYGNALKNRLEEGLNISEAASKLLEKGVEPELLNQFAYEIASSSINEVLYRLADPGGADYDLEDDGERLPAWILKERTSDYKETGRTVAETHNLLPFSNY